MTYAQVKDLLDRVRSFHQRWNDALDDCDVRPDGEEPDEGMPLLEVVRRHLAEFERDTTAKPTAGDGPDAALLETWLQFVPEEAIETAVRELESNPTADPQEIVQRTHDYLTGFEQLYDSLAGASSAESMRAYFQRMQQRTQWEIERLGWDTRPATE